MAQKPPTNTCLMFLANICLAFRFLTKVFTSTLTHDHLPFISCKHLPSPEGNNLPLGVLLRGAGRPSAAYSCSEKNTACKGDGISDSSWTTASTKSRVA